MNAPVVWEQDFKVNTLLADTRQRLGLVGLLNVLQDAAWEHADQVGFGYRDLQARGAFWVLTRQRLEMAHWPAWGAVVTLRTWGRPFEGATARRDFELLEGGRPIGSCASDWLNLDLSSRRPVRLRAEGAGAWCRQDHALDYVPQKLDAKADWAELASFRVRNSDLDLQGHVNNTRYASWVLDALPLIELEGMDLKTYEANFLAETLPEDPVALQAAPETQDSSGLFERRFQGLRPADGKTLFLSRLLFSRA